MKKLLAILLATIMLVSLSACGDETTLDDLLDSLDSLTSSQDEENSSHDKNQEDGSQTDASQGDVSQGDASQGDASQVDASQGDASQGDASQGDASQADGSQGGTSQTDGSQAEKNQEDSKNDNSTSYSTNDLETAKKGNSGVFAYKKGSSYDIYYIVDFDEGYVYRFTDGNGEELCDRLKIDSGDLNSILIVTYHSGNDSWQNGLHFKWKNQPDIMILEDGNGEYKFTTTDLDNALAIRDTKTIQDY